MRSISAYPFVYAQGESFPTTRGSSQDFKILWGEERGRHPYSSVRLYSTNYLTLDSLLTMANDTTSIDAEEMFDIDTDHPEPVYDNPPMTTGWNDELELYGVDADDKEMQIKYRQPKHQGFATENYKFGHGPQKFVLQAIINRFDLKLRKATWKQDLVQQVRALEGTTIKAYVTKADIGETLYNIDNKKS